LTKYGTMRKAQFALMDPGIAIGRCEWIFSAIRYDDDVVSDYRPQGDRVPEKIPQQRPQERL
jgi:hypothetical protein